jgi:hypothetical protein
MDPVTTAIIAALTAGATTGGTELVKKGVSDGYDRIKSLLKEKFGHNSEVVKKVTDLETKPDSEGRRATLQEEIAAAKADQDSDLVKAAQAILEELKAQPRGAQFIQTATGSNIAQAAGGSTSTVKVNQPKES